MISTYLLALLLLCVMGGSVDAASVPLQEGETLEVFTRAGCPRCVAAAAFLEVLQKEYPKLQIVTYDVESDSGALQRLHTLAAQRKISVVGVPAFFLREELLIGFANAETTGAQIKSLFTPQRPSLPEASPSGICTPDATSPCPSDAEEKGDNEDTVDVPLLGRLSPTALGLPFFTIVLGLLDEFNPCAMWVLLFLLSLLVNLRDRAKMFLIGGAFVLVSGIVYFAFMAAWLNLFWLIGFSRMTQLVLGLVAFFIGAVNVKDFFAFGYGPSLSIPAAAKPGLYARVRRILQAENVSGAVVSVLILAVLVNTVELLCTAGLPAVYTHVLTLYQLPWWTYYGYLALYNIAYVPDDSLMLLVAVVTLSHHKLQEREGRWLKLVSGAVMLSLGAVLMLKPDWLAVLP